jgi:hypothetical protein
MKHALMYAAAVVAVLLVVSSCKKEDDITVGDRPREFQVRIDSVKLSKNVARTDTLKAFLWGTIGNSTCYQFARYESTRDSFEIRLKVFGRYTPSSTCSPSAVQLRQAIFRIYPVYAGTFTVYVLQPDGSMLRDMSLVL